MKCIKCGQLLENCCGGNICCNCQDRSRVKVGYDGITQSTRKTSNHASNQQWKTGAPFYSDNHGYSGGHSGGYSGGHHGCSDNQCISPSPILCAPNFGCNGCKKCKGPPGPRGLTGPPGADGRDGRDGRDGKDGRDGRNGNNGPQGPRGPQGPQGPEGDCCQPCTMQFIGSEIGVQGQLVEIVKAPGAEKANVRPLQMNNIPSWLWAYNSESVDFDEARGVAVDCLGNVYVIGTFEGSLVIGNTELISFNGTMAFVAKFDSDGNPLWAVQGTVLFPNTNANGYAIVTDCSNNVYIAGNFQFGITFGDFSITSGSISTYNTFVAKLDSEGTFLWAYNTTGSSGDNNPNGIDVDCDGNVFVVGAFNNSITFPILSTTLSNSGNTNTFVLKMDTDGTPLWAVQTGDSENDFYNVGNGIVVDCEGDAYIVGTFEGTIEFLPDITIDFGLDGEQIYVAKIDTDGDWVWAQHGGGDEGPAAGCGIAIDCACNVYITGSITGTSTFGIITVTPTNGGSNVVVAKLDFNGSWIWAKSAGSSASTQTAAKGRAIEVDCHGNIYITGTFDTDIRFGKIILDAIANSTDIFVAKLTAKCKWVFADSIGSSGDFDIGYDLALDCESNLLVAGSFSGSVRFGNFPLSSGGSPPSVDMFVAKLSSCMKGIYGFLESNVGTSGMVDVVFPGATVSRPIFTSLIPGCRYYLDCKCRLSTCCRCAQDFVGVACCPTRMIMGVKDPCSKRCCLPSTVINTTIVNNLPVP